MEAARTSETMVNFYQTTWRYNPEDNYLLTHRRENLKYYICNLSKIQSYCTFYHSVHYTLRFLTRNNIPTSVDKTSYRAVTNVICIRITHFESQPRNILRLILKIVRYHFLLHPSHLI
jgi:hypothetical protein